MEGPLGRPHDATATVLHEGWCATPCPTGHRRGGIGRPFYQRTVTAGARCASYPRRRAPGDPSEAPIHFC
jgi:hypothetical protein